MSNEKNWKIYKSVESDHHTLLYNKKKVVDEIIENNRIHYRDLTNEIFQLSLEKTLAKITEYE